MRQVGIKSDERKVKEPAHALASFFSFIVLLSLGLVPARAAEVSTNGIGGGAWSDPETWRAKQTPVAGDDVVIQKGDTVTFDRNDDGKVTCQKLFLDPKASLLFKTGAGKIVLCLADVAESYGTIKLDGTKAAADLLELRLVAAEPTNRAIKLLKGGALLVYGRKNLPRDGRNVVLASPQLAGKDGKLADAIGTVDGGPGTMLDIQRAAIASLHLTATTIDNTGAKANERVNFIANRCTGPSRLACMTCDTPVLDENTFDYDGAAVVQYAALNVSDSSLAEAKKNTIRGKYLYGLYAYGAVDAAMTDNVIEKCGTGAYVNSCSNLMLKDTVIRDCETGCYFHLCNPAVAEGIVVEGAKTGMESYGAIVQLMSCQVSKLLKGGDAYRFNHPSGGNLTLINCNITASEIKVVALPPKVLVPPVLAMHYLIVNVEGAPVAAQVDVRTTNPVPPLAKGAADPNVRGTPAPITKDFTPLPQTLKPLLLSAWSLDAAGKLVPAPDYTVSVFLPPAKEGMPPQVLKTVSVKPLDTWFRPSPNEAVPTLKVSLK